MRQKFRLKSGVQQIVLVFITSSLAMLSLHCAAQSNKPDTLLELPPVFINAERTLPEAIGELSTSWADSSIQLYANRSLDRLLQRETGAYIRSYGAGGIATISLRGSSSSQVAVSWNGVLLANPMIGVPDFSLIPASAVDRVSLDRGGNSAIVGSGAIGGNIELNSATSCPTGFSADINTEIGSFGLWEQGVSLSFGNGKIGGKTRYYHTFSDNDFPYQASPGQPELELPNARENRFGVVQDIVYRPSERDVISAHIWWQEYDRQIPPTTVQSSSDAFQEDMTIRSVINWRHTRKVISFNAKAAYFRDEILYEDPQRFTSNLSTSTTAVAEATATWSMDPTQSVTFGMNHYRLTGDIDAYEGLEVQNRTAIFLHQRQTFLKWAMELSLRQEFVDGSFSPFLMSLGLDYEPANWLKLHGKVSRDYRLPGINDLYWIPGGNPDLKPEKGWSKELGLTLTHGANPIIEFDLTGFNRTISDWILWGIIPGETFFSAHNLTEVHSRGMEAAVNVATTIGDVIIDFNSGYAFTRSTNEVPVESPHIEAGQQLAYTPEHKAHGAFTTRFKNITLQYTHTYTGQVISERNDILEGFNIGDLCVTYRLNLRSLTIKPKIELLNMWDTEYRVIQYRPMPGRNIRFGLQFNFNK